MEPIDSSHSNVPFSAPAQFAVMLGMEQELSPQLQTVPLPSPRGRVLVMEDDWVQLQMLEQHLQSVGFEVLTAASIAQARQRLSEQRLQLAILDVQLPDGCGFELCEQIDNDPAHSGLPVVMLSSLKEAGAVRRTRASGGRYFLSKPYDPNVLLAIIERALEDGIN